MTRLATRVLLIAALCLMLFHFAVYVVYAANLAGFPFDYDQGEGFELNDTVLLSQGQSPYRANEVYPFYASNYPPLYHVFLVPFVWLFGPQYWYGRLFGFLATLVTAAAIGFAVHRETRHRWIAILAGLAFLASNYIYQISPLFRQHITMVMFETLAIVLLARCFPPAAEREARGERLNRRTLLLAMLCLLAAGFTKQMAVTTVAGFFLFLFLRMPRRAVLLGIGFGGVAAILFLLLNVITGGQWWINIITANVNSYSPGQFYGLAGQFFSLHGALFVLACLYILYELYFTRLSVYSVWLAASTGSAILSGKWGAGDSYFSTLIAAMCILSGLFAARALAGDWPVSANYLTRRLARFSLVRWRSAAGIGALLAFSIYGLAVFKMPLDLPGFSTLAQVLNLHSNTNFPGFYDSAKWVVGYAKLGQIPTAQDVENGWKIVAYAKEDPRAILSEEAAFSFRSGKPVVSNPTQLLNLYNNSAYDPAALVAMIRGKQFGLVIFRARFYPQPVLEAVDAAYQVIATIPMNDYQYTLMRPRGP